MKNKIALITAVLSILLLSGCVSNNQSAENKNVTVVPTAEQTPKLAENTNISSVTGTPANAGAGSAGSNRTLNASPGNLSGWCTPGSKINVSLPDGAKVFTVTNETAFQGRNVCRAELVTKNGTNEYYFSKDGTFKIMNATASGKNVTAEAMTNVTVK